MTSHRTITVAAVTAAIGALAAGCGSQSPTSRRTQGSQGPGQAAYAFARCMRRHGIPNFPDPKVSVTPTQTRIAQAAPQSLVNTPGFKTAQKACAPLQPGPGSGGQDTHGPGKPVLLAFARCLRAQGITNFPDPSPQGQISGEMLRAAGVDIHAPGLLTAARSCVGVTHGAITMAMVVAAVNHH